MKQYFDLTGKIAVVTGASSGLGASAALAYAEYGAKVALLARRVEKLNNLKEKIETVGGRALAIKCDISKEEDVKTAMEKILTTYGKIDILLNAAGVAIMGDVESLSTEDWDKVINTNLKGVFLTTKYVIPEMKKNKYGKIVNISSVNAVYADKSDKIARHSYNASKGGVASLTRGMAATYAKYGITVNAVAPGLFATEMTEEMLNLPGFTERYNHRNPSRRRGNPDELNGTILYLSSDASSYVQGQFIIVDGGDAIV